MQKRLAQELRKFKEEGPGALPMGITVSPDEDMKLWHASIMGPPGSAYEGGVYKIVMQFKANDKGEKYPFVPPLVGFVTPIFHPNICPASGSICLDILKTAWSPSFQIVTLLMQLQGLLETPNPADPLNRVAGQLMLSDHDKFLQTVQEWIKRHAQPDHCAHAPLMLAPTSSVAASMVRPGGYDVVQPETALSVQRESEVPKASEEAEEAGAIV